MMRSLWSAVSGLNTHQMEMDVIGNNISNVNTTAFKASATGFQDVLYQTIKNGGAATQNRASTNADQVGLGAKMGSIMANITKQGSAVMTNNAFDLMINGDAFFVVDEVAGTGSWIYTRDGSFTIDGTGSLVTQNNGYHVGCVTGVGITGGSGQLISDITKIMPGQATTESYIKGNIDKYDKNLEEGKNIMMEMYGSDGNTYTLKFKLTDNADTDDSTYRISLNSVVDQDGTKIGGFTKESVLLRYDKHTGELESVTPDYDVSMTKTVTRDDDNNVINTTISFDDKIKSSAFTSEITGKDGKKYTLYYNMYEDASIPEDLVDDDEDLPDYKFTVYGISYYDSAAGKTVFEDIDDKVLYLNYNDESGVFEGILGEDGSTYEFDFEDLGLDIGTVTFDFSKSIDLISTGTSFNFSFDDAIKDRLGGALTVDFAYSTNYAGNMGGHSSTVYAYKGNYEGLNKGYPVGELTGISISDDGSIYGRYSNGENQLLAKLSFAEFTNAMGLEQIGNNMYRASLNSGEPIWVDITYNGGYISSGYLEGSNVDLAKEFTDMITTQRGFQANSRVITTSDEMLQTLKALKR